MALSRRNQSAGRELEHDSRFASLPYKTKQIQSRKRNNISTRRHSLSNFLPFSAPLLHVVFITATSILYCHIIAFSRWIKVFHCLKLPNHNSTHICFQHPNLRHRIYFHKSFPYLTIVLYGNSLAATLLLPKYCYIFFFRFHFSFL